MLIFFLQLYLFMKRLDIFEVSISMSNLSLPFPSVIYKLFYFISKVDYKVMDSLWSSILGDVFLSVTETKLKDCTSKLVLYNR